MLRSFFTRLVITLLLLGAPAFAASVPVTAMSRSGNQILSLTVSGSAFGQSRLQTGTVTTFAASSASSLLVPDGVVPTSGSGAPGYVSDFLLDTGLINSAASATAVTVTFSPALVNRPGADVVFLEINPSPSADSFQVRINGVTLTVASAEWGNTGVSTASADVYKTRNAGNTADATVTTLAQLIAAPVIISSSDINQVVFGVALDLSDFGVAAGATVSSIQYGATATATAVDMVLIAGLTPPAELTAGPVISEFVADNADGLEDENGDKPDWIEVYNGTANPAILTDWRLTDDAALPAKWTFPASTTLQPYEARVIYASGKNRAAPQMHTNFDLAKAGGYLALIRPDGSVASAFTYGAQSEDTSYGIKGAALTNGFLATPTPGAINSGPQEANGHLGEVVFNVESGPVTADVTLGMSLPVGAPVAAVIRYTTNLAEPTETSPIYTTPLVFTGSATARARIFSSGYLPGNIGNRHFTRLAADVASNYRGTGQPFRSTLPVLVLDSFGVNVDSNTTQTAPYRTTLASLYDVDGTGQSSLAAVPTLVKRSGTHVRGQSSANFPQHQYAWELWRPHEDTDDDVALLGMPKGADWVLHAPWNDKTLLRNAFAYGLARDWAGDGGGMRTRFVEVFFNQTGTTLDHADYKGVYVLCEKIERSGDRVNVEKQNALTSDITGGYIFAKDKLPAENAFSTTTTSAWGSQPLDMLEPKVPTSAQLTYLTNYMNGFEAALASPTFADPGTGYAAYIDATSWQDWHLMAELARQSDAFSNSNYFHKKRGQLARALPVWDFNIAYANTTEQPIGGSVQPGQNPSEGWHWIRLFDDWLSQKGPSTYPWFPRLFQDAEFTRGYWDRYWSKRRSILTATAMNARIDSLAAQVNAGSATPVTNGTGTWPASTPSVESPAGRHFARWQILGTYVWTTPQGYADRTTHAHEVAYLKQWVTQRLEWMDSQSMATTPSTTAPAVASVVARPPDIAPFGGNLAPGSSFTIGNPNIGGATVLYTVNGPDPRNVGGGINVGALSAPAAQFTSNELLPIGTTWKFLAPASAPAVTWETSGFDDSSWANIVSPRDITQATTAYFRKTFTASGIAGIQAVLFDMLVDDGAVVWLNGVELRRVGVPFAPTGVTHTTAATALIDKAHEGEWMTWLVPANALVEGTNTLAVEVHQFDYTLNPTIAATTDLSFELRVRALTLTPGSALTFSSSGAHTVRSRVKSGSDWSPLSEATFIVSAIPAAPTNLVISELMYHPANPTAAEIAAGYNDDNDFEFIELTNISNSAVDLTGVTLEDAISFNFNTAPPAARFLAPGARVIVVEDQAAFLIRYPGSTATIAGQYAGNFSDSNEQVTLRAANGSILRRFTYRDEDPWPVDADGTGASLVLNALADIDHTVPSHWHASAASFGAPGLADHTMPPADPNGDSNQNGFSNFYEYALGTTALPTLAFEPSTPPLGTASTYAIFRFRRNLAADSTSYIAESTTNLTTPNGWTGTELTYVSTVRQPDGTAIVTYRSTLPAPQLPANFFVRLRAVR